MIQEYVENTIIKFSSLEKEDLLPHVITKFLKYYFIII